MLVLNDLKEDECTAPNMGRVVLILVGLILLMPITSAVDSFTTNTAGGEVWFDCENTWASVIDEQDNILANNSDFSISIEAGEHTFRLENQENCQWVIPISEELPNLRPAPSEQFPNIDTSVCNQEGVVNTSCAGTLVSGDLHNDTADIFSILVQPNQIVSLNLEAASSAISVSVHFQNQSTETRLDYDISTALNTSIGGKEELLIPISDAGRLIITVSSPNPESLWMMKTKIFSTDGYSILPQSGETTGVGNKSFVTYVGADQSAIIEKSQNLENGISINVSYRYAFTSDTFSPWNSVQQGDRILGIDNIHQLELKWDCDCRWAANISFHTHYDADWGIDAPGFRPLSPNSDNSTYPLIEMDGSAFDGELTLHMGDYQDVLRVETTGWNESVHLIDVVVEGDIYDIQVKIVNIDQDTWDILDERTATYSMDRIKLSLDVGLGTHFILIQHINGSDSIDINAEEKEWRIRVNTAVLDEGEEPWFPASEAVKEAAEVFYWLMGGILILPFVIFVINVKKTKRYAEEFARKKNRLAWLSKKLDEGTFSQTDLTRALKSVSSLEWEQALEAWGEAEVRHYTTGIDMAIWNLDHRIGDDGAWPILIGLRPQNCEWSVAALKFEANDGGEWSVAKVVPKLLKRANEVFLDTISTNSRVFIRVDLSGNANSVDVYLSGMVDGQPVAAKPANTVYRQNDDSEE